VRSLSALARVADAALEATSGEALLILNMNAIRTNAELRCHLGVCQSNGLLPPPLANPLVELLRQSEKDLARASLARTTTAAIEALRTLVRRNRDVLLRSASDAEP
jgi:hypothetical protein